MFQKHISVLITLAKRDGHIDESERNLIFKIGRAHGVSEEEIAELIKSPLAPTDFSSFTDEERFKVLHDLVHLMKVDGEIFDEEITYCMDMSKRLNFPMEAVMDLYAMVHANVRIPAELQRLQRKYCAEKK